MEDRYGDKLARPDGAVGCRWHASLPGRSANLCDNTLDDTRLRPWKALPHKPSQVRLISPSDKPGVSPEFPRFAVPALPPKPHGGALRPTRKHARLCDPTSEGVLKRAAVVEGFHMRIEEESHAIRWSNMKTLYTELVHAMMGSSILTLSACVAQAKACRADISWPEYGRAIQRLQELTELEEDLHVAIGSVSEDFIMQTLAKANKVTAERWPLVIAASQRLSALNATKRALFCESKGCSIQHLASIIYSARAMGPVANCWSEFRQAEMRLLFLHRLLKRLCVGTNAVQNAASFCCEDSSIIELERAVEDAKRDGIDDHTESPLGPAFAAALSRLRHLQACELNDDEMLKALQGRLLEIDSGEAYCTVEFEMAFSGLDIVSRSGGNFAPVFDELAQELAEATGFEPGCFGIDIRSDGPPFGTVVVVKCSVRMYTSAKCGGGGEADTRLVAGIVQRVIGCSSLLRAAYDMVTTRFIKPPTVKRESGRLAWHPQLKALAEAPDKNIALTTFGALVLARDHGVIETGLTPALAAKFGCRAALERLWTMLKRTRLNVAGLESLEAVLWEDRRTNMKQQCLLNDLVDAPTDKACVVEDLREAVVQSEITQARLKLGGCWRDDAQISAERHLLNRARDRLSVAAALEVELTLLVSQQVFCSASKPPPSRGAIIAALSHADALGGQAWLSRVRLEELLQERVAAEARLQDAFASGTPESLVQAVCFAESVGIGSSSIAKAAAAQTLSMAGALSLSSDTVRLLSKVATQGRHQHLNEESPQEGLHVAFLFENARLPPIFEEENCTELLRQTLEPLFLPVTRGNAQMVRALMIEKEQPHCIVVEMVLWSPDIPAMQAELAKLGQCLGGDGKMICTNRRRSELEYFKKCQEKGPEAGSEDCSEVLSALEDSSETAEGAEAPSVPVCNRTVAKCVIKAALLRCTERDGEPQFFPNDVAGIACPQLRPAMEANNPTTELSAAQVDGTLAGGGDLMADLRNCLQGYGARFLHSHVISANPVAKENRVNFFAAAGQPELLVRDGYSRPPTPLVMRPKSTGASSIPVLSRSGSPEFADNVREIVGHIAESATMARPMSGQGSASSGGASNPRSVEAIPRSSWAGLLDFPLAGAMYSVPEVIASSSDPGVLETSFAGTMTSVPESDAHTDAFLHDAFQQFRKRGETAAQVSEEGTSARSSCITLDPSVSRLVAEIEARLLEADEAGDGKAQSGPASTRPAPTGSASRPMSVSTLIFESEAPAQTSRVASKSPATRPLSASARCADVEGRAESQRHCPARSPSGISTASVASFTGQAPSTSQYCADIFAHAGIPERNSSKSSSLSVSKEEAKWLIGQMFDNTLRPGQMAQHSSMSSSLSQGVQLPPITSANPPQLNRGTSGSWVASSDSAATAEAKVAISAIFAKVIPQGTSQEVAHLSGGSTGLITSYLSGK